MSGFMRPGLWLRQCVREREGVRHFEVRAYDNESGERVRHFALSETAALTWLEDMLAQGWQKTPRQGGRR